MEEAASQALLQLMALHLTRPSRHPVLLPQGHAVPFQDFHSGSCKQTVFRSTLRSDREAGKDKDESLLRQRGWD